MKKSQFFDCLVRFLFVRSHFIYSLLKWGRLKRKTNIKLNLGAGPHKGNNGWTNIDMLPQTDIVWDLRRGIPLPDSSVSCIYSSHLLEHIPAPQQAVFLSECHRVLAKNGEFIGCVPDAGKFIDAYSQNRELIPKDQWYINALVETNSIMDQLNYIAYLGGQHHYMFDEQNIVNILTDAGFSNCKIRQFDPVYDKLERRNMSLHFYGEK